MFEFARGPYPATRMRRVRRFDWSRRLVCESTLSCDDLIWPLFVFDGNGRQAVDSLPGVERLGTDEVCRAAVDACKLGIPAIAIFPATPAELKTEDAREAVNPGNLVCRTVRAIKQEVGDQLGVICDVALDPYSSHGQDGLVRHGDVANDETIAVLCQQALVQAEAGCDIIAPSDMMDGRIAAIRGALESRAMHQRANHVLRSQVRQRILRALSRRRRFGGQSGRGVQKNLSTSTLARK